MPELTPKQEFEVLRFQFGTSSEKGIGGKRNLPYVFTEPGVAMQSSAPLLPKDRKKIGSN